MSVFQRGSVYHVFVCAYVYVCIPYFVRAWYPQRAESTGLKIQVLATEPGSLKEQPVHLQSYLSCMCV